MKRSSLQLPFEPSCRIVVADDELFTRFMTVELLERLGNPTILLAKDGHEAFEVLNDTSASPPDLVFLDLHMPGANGIEILKEIRSGHTQVPYDVPVFILTSHDGLDLLMSAWVLDVDAFLKKPMTLLNLTDNITDVLISERSMQESVYYSEIDIEGIHIKSLSTTFNDEAIIDTVTATELIPGMVIAEDITQPTGALLVGAGSIVTSRMSRLLKGVESYGHAHGYRVVRNPEAAILSASLF